MGVLVLSNSWMHRPTIIDTWPTKHRFLMAIDENGTGDLRGVMRPLKKGRPINPKDHYVTLTGVVFDRARFQSIKTAVVNLKSKYWPPDGKFNYNGDRRSVCFHSREIRKSEGPFALLDESKRNNFLNDLSVLIGNCQVCVYSATVKKYELCQRYAYPEHPYSLALGFIVERFCILLQRTKSTGIILVESRGKKEDTQLLASFRKLQVSGNTYYPPEHFASIAGFYFNPKWDPAGKSYIPLELADLMSYPIFRHVRDGYRGRDFRIVERKLLGYPDYRGKGLKVFP